MAEMKEMNFREKVSRVQREMKAPKNLFNSFGKYKYRNAESILEAFKPYEEKYGLYLMISDTVEEIGGRFYVKATATLVDVENGAEISASALAREPESKKGMDESQITGTASSYARKYALGGLFLLDDTKDADTDEYAEQTGREKKPASNPDSRITAKKETVKNICGKHHTTPERICCANRIEWEAITEDQLDGIMRAFQAKGW